MSTAKQNIEVKILIRGEDLISPELKTERDLLLTNAREIKSVATKEQNCLNAQSVVAERKHVKAMEEKRKEITRRFDDAKKIVMDFFSEHCDPLTTEIERQQKLGTNFVEAENRRVAEEEAERQRQFQEAQQAQFNAPNKVQEMIARRKVENIIATPEPEAARAKGQTLKQVLCYEVTDILALVKARPDLCKIEAKALAIKAVCHPNLPIAGLRLWFENQSTYTTR